MKSVAGDWRSLYKICAGPFTTVKLGTHPDGSYATNGGSSACMHMHALLGHIPGAPKQQHIFASQIRYFVIPTAVKDAKG